MRKFLILSLTLIAFSSCEKWGRNKHKACPAVAVESVPQPVKDAFTAKYKTAAVETWYNKDNAHMVAKFTNNGKITLSSFTNDGIFEKEQITGDNQQGDHQDNNDEGCNCGEQEGD